MKSMSELIQSVKDEKLKKVAEDLKEKLANVGRTIAEKRKKGEQVTENESASLKKSLSGYVKKGLSVALVSAMLVSMLSGCDELIEALNESSSESAMTEIGGTVIGDVGNEYVTVYDGGAGLFDEAEEVYNNGVNGEYGLDGMFSELNVEELILNSRYSTYLDRMYENLQERCNNNEAFDGSDKEYVDKYIAGIGQVANGEKGPIVLTIKKDEWENKVLMSKNTFAIRTKNTDTGKLYLTGFVKGEFKDDLNMVDERVEELAKSITQDQEGYEENIASMQKSFWGMILRDALDPNSNAFSGKFRLTIDYSYSRNEKIFDTKLKTIKHCEDGSSLPNYVLEVDSGPYMQDINAIINEVEMKQIADNANQQLN